MCEQAVRTYRKYRIFQNITRDQYMYCTQRGNQNMVFEIKIKNIYVSFY